MVAIPLETNEEALVFHNRRMAARRVELGFMQAQAAAKAGMLQGQWTRYEVGIHAPGADALVRIAKALECSTDYLLGLAEAPDALSSLPADEQSVIKDYRVQRQQAKIAVIDEKLSKYQKAYRGLVERAIAYLESKTEIKDSDNKV
jgi:transcriptional regulator with XRE-family HTH domain